jgi:two-component system, cell cycle response regulator CtrA
MRVLLVEDDPPTAASIKLMLEKENFICDTTDLGEDGLEIGKIYDYDIIILDLMLPDIDGYEVLRRLRAARVRTPILILSGLAELDHKIKGLGFGADDFLTKPLCAAPKGTRNRRSAPASWWSISIPASCRSMTSRFT